ncbi:MAG TPA: hypothetical protein VJ894_00785, partial [Cryomorphaceae bacterium]|nr:hypothetical protein [Cryomorphaceae bacterium]
FILVRFSGYSAKILHVFRAVYVGGFVVAFGLSFQILAFARLIEVFYGFNSFKALIIAGAAVCLFSVKNSLQLKLRYDLFHAILYFIALGTLYYFIQSETDGFSNGIQFLRNQSDSVLNILPSWDEPKLIYSLAIFVGVQWWSAQLFDGGGVEMARYTATKSPQKAMAAGLFRDALGLATGLFTMVIVILAFAVNLSAGEIGFVKTIFKVVPMPYTDFIFLGFFALFITTAEATINWGSSFLTEDLYRGYLNPKVSQKKYRLIGILLMVGLSIAATIIAYYGEQLEILIKILFSISAGVSPVYILRWFWLRINAWSQISAMISSGLYTLLFLYMESRFEPWWNTEVFDTYEVRLLAVTLLTSITWLMVTFLTPRDSEETLAKFRGILPNGRTVILQFGVALALGILITGLFAFSIYAIIN